ncbi:MAG: molybdenum cofactor guanylyltransferase [Saprospiraceae bacterium]|nr:molybdenum cofactor guanylyltransferase [Saprospiraceae bacterium]
MNIIILAGGHSKRMGRDKGDLVYYDRPQKYYLYNMLFEAGHDVYISQRSDQDRNEAYRYILDPEQNIGPMGGIVSAMEQKYEGWLIVGCDYPYFNLDAVNFLIENRNTDAYATCFIDPESGYIIPTCGIYETRILTQFHKAIERESYGLFRLLKELDVHLIHARENWMFGVNSYDTYQAVKKEMKK